MNIKPEMRIGDQERAAAASALGEHYAAGRLTREEYDERSEQVWGATTHSDLRPLFVDLPSSQPPRRTSVTTPSPTTRRGFRMPLLPLIALVIFLAVVVPFPVWILIGVMAFMFMRGAFGFGGCGRSHKSSGPPR